MQPALDEEIKRSIQAAYSNWLDAKGFSARYGQRLMIAEIARTIAVADSDDAEAEPIAAIEAGTGTGKTIAYAVAALPLARAMGKTLVISTATVALQEQIVEKDLPDVAGYGGLDFSFALAKGRGRYACLAKLDSLLRGAEGQPALALYPDESQLLPTADRDIYEQMLSAVGAASWDGDRDGWPQAVEQRTWSAISTDHFQCSAGRCPFVAQCPFYRAREKQETVDCIVANHDLVLSDLGLGGGVVLPAPEDTIYVFDEAHHLPDKARQHFSNHLRLDQFGQWLDQCEQDLLAIGSRLAAKPSLQDQIAKTLPELKVLREQSQAMVAPLDEIRSEQPVRRDGDFWSLRLSNGEVPAELAGLAVPLAEATGRLRDRLATIEESLRQIMDDTQSSSEIDLQSLCNAAGQHLGRFDAANRLWTAWSQADPDDGPPNARWMRGRLNEQSDLSLNSSPIVAAPVLRELLWSRCHAAILTSATLTALGSFERIRMHAGLPESANYCVVPSPFRYQEMATLAVPDLPSDPSDPPAHTEAVIDWLNKTIDRREASLVLFASRRQMLDTYDGIVDDLRDSVLMQDHFSKQELLRRHRKRVDSDQGSVIFGLASFSEGIDLPGSYCQHVVIAKIPFAVPDEPIEEALAEWIESQGGNAFMQISVPDAALRLVQASGRLLRSENDRGRISLLDRRIISRRYGRQMLDSLPPYRREDR